MLCVLRREQRMLKLVIHAACCVNKYRGTTSDRDASQHLLHYRNLTWLDSHPGVMHMHHAYRHTEPGIIRVPKTHLSILDRVYW